LLITDFDIAPAEKREELSVSPDLLEIQIELFLVRKDDDYRGYGLLEDLACRHRVDWNFKSSCHDGLILLTAMELRATRPPRGDSCRSEGLGNNPSESTVRAWAEGGWVETRPPIAVDVRTKP
jgi:hypothetical protein